MSSVTSWPASCVTEREPLANHTSFRIGGPAEWYAEPSTIDELIELLRGADAAGMPVSIIGGGTNLLVSDRGIRGLVVRLGRGFRHAEVISPPEDEEVLVRCGAAVSTQHLVRLASRHGWGRVESLAGLPGQVGGAVMMNAQNIGVFVERITLVSPMGSVSDVRKDRLLFAYRYAAVEPGIVVEVLLRFPKASVEDSASRIHQALCYRNATQDLGLPSAGCAFKNPSGDSAGRLLDRAGLKGHRVGDAQISPRHANFIVNLGQATFDDVLGLMEHAQRRVLREFGIRLEPEIRMLGERV